MNTAVWTSATATLTAIRAVTIDAVPTGASRSRRSSFFCRQLTRVSAAAERGAGGDRPAEQAGRQVLDRLERLVLDLLGGQLVDAAAYAGRGLVRRLHDRGEHAVDHPGRDLVGDRVVHDEPAALLLHGGVDVGLADLVQGVGQAGGVVTVSTLSSWPLAAGAWSSTVTRPTSTTLILGVLVLL